MMNEMTSKATIMVLFANAYEMTNEKGQAMSGCTVHYLFWGQYGEKLMGTAEFNPQKSVGVQRAKCSVDIALRENVVVAPALYEGTFVMAVGGDGKPVLKLVDLAFLSHVDIKAKIIRGFQCPGQIPEEEAAEKLGLKFDGADAPKAAETAKGAK